MTTTAVITKTFNSPAGPDGGADRQAYVTFTEDGRAASAQIALPACHGACARDYPAGRHVTITYTAGQPATAVFGRPSVPGLHLNEAVIAMGLLGTVFLAASLVNLVFGVEPKALAGRRP